MRLGSRTASSSVTKLGAALSLFIACTSNLPNGVTPISALAINDATPAYTTYESLRTVALPAGLAANATTVPAVDATGARTWTFDGPLAPAASGSVAYTAVVD